MPATSLDLKNLLIEVLLFLVAVALGSWACKQFDAPEPLKWVVLVIILLAFLRLFHQI